VTPKLLRFSQRYQAALRKHVVASPRANLPDAERLGRQAVVFGLEALGLARIHDQAMATLPLPHAKDGRSKQTDAFFARAVAPIERTHYRAEEASAPVLEIRKTLRQRTRDLATSNRRLERGIVHRKALEKTLKRNGDHYIQLLKESRKLQLRLRHLTHQVLSAQEKERGKVSSELHNEIGQILVGINVRLTTLRKVATVDSKSLKRQIATTQRLVDHSTDAMHRFASEFGKRDGS